MTRYPRLQLLSLVVVFTAAFFGTAEAKKPKPLPTRPEVHRLTGSSPIIRLGPAGPAEGPCSGGAAFDPFDIYDGYIDVADGTDSYYTLIDPASCTPCGPDSQLKVTSVQADITKVYGRASWAIREPPAPGRTAAPPGRKSCRTTGPSTGDTRSP